MMDVLYEMKRLELLITLFQCPIARQVLQYYSFPVIFFRECELLAADDEIRTDTRGD